MVFLVVINGGVPYMGDPPIAGWFIRENPSKIRMIGGYPHFRKPPNVVFFFLIL